MKNFLLVVTLVGVVIGQIFFSSQAEAYNEGDKLCIMLHECQMCGKQGLSMYLNGKDIRDDCHDIEVSGYCPYYYPDKRPHRNWLDIGERIYIYRNGQWIETYREGRWYE